MSRGARGAAGYFKISRENTEHQIAAIGKIVSDDVK